MKILFTAFRYSISLIALATLSQCTLRDRVSDSPTGPSLKFRLVRINSATLGTLDVKPLNQPEDLALEPRSQLIREYVSGNLPLRMQLTLEASDPSLSGRTLNLADYEVSLDDKPLGKAQAALNLVLPADGSPVQFPLIFDMNTRKLLGDDAMPALRNFAVGLADRRRRPMRLALRLRPIANKGEASLANNYLPVEMDSVATPMP